MSYKDKLRDIIEWQIELLHREANIEIFDKNQRDVFKLMTDVGKLLEDTPTESQAEPVSKELIAKLREIYAEDSNG